mgnify:CR=1 FL=1
MNDKKINENKEKLLNLLGLATRARKTSIGSDTCLKMISSKKAVIVFVANDASEGTIEKFNNKCFYYNILLDLTFNSVELSQAIGKNNAKVLTVNDQGFAKSIKNILKDGVKYEG